MKRPPRRRTAQRPLHAILLLTAALLVPACRAVDNPEELQALAGDGGAELAAAAGTAPPAPAAAPAPRDVFGGFPPVGSVYPGLAGRLHSSLCDPFSDPQSNCI